MDVLERVCVLGIHRPERAGETAVVLRRGEAEAAIAPAEDQEAVHTRNVC